MSIPVILMTDTLIMEKVKSRRTPPVAPAPSLEQRVLRLRHVAQMKIVAVGDSSVYGVGDFDQNHETVGAGWTGRFAHDVKAERFINLGRNGARFRHIVGNQLAGAISMRPNLVLLCAGTNDVLRGDFSPQEIAAAISTLVNKCNEIGALAVILGIPDPIKTAPGPLSLKKILHERVKIVNSTLNEICSTEGAIFISTWDLAMATDKTMWHIDRMHPSARGHQEISDLVRRSLNLPRRSRKKLPIERNTPKRKDEIFWLLTNGLKWFAKRSIDLVPALIWLVISTQFSRRKVVK